MNEDNFKSNLKPSKNNKNIVMILIVLALIGVVVAIYMQTNNKTIKNKYRDEVYVAESYSKGKPYPDKMGDKAIKDIFGNNYMDNYYISDKDNLKFFIKEVNTEDNDTINITPLYDIPRFEDKIKDISYDQFINIIENYKYEDKLTQIPEEILETGTGNCSSITLFMYEWLKINRNPEENKYILKIVENKSDINSKYDGHMFLSVKPDGKSKLLLDLSIESSKFDQIDELKTLI